MLMEWNDGMQMRMRMRMQTTQNGPASWIIANDDRTQWHIL